MENAEAYLTRLRPIYLFKGFSDEQILALARDFTVEQRQKGEVLFNQGERGEAFYIINRGRIAITRRTGKREATFANLGPGDFFGEMALLRNIPRTGTATVAEDAELLVLGRERFDEDLRTVESLRENLVLMADSRDMLRRMHLNWLFPGEIVYAVARRHPILLYQQLLLPILVMIVSMAAGVGVFSYLGDLVLGAAVGGLGALVSLAWMGWLNLDWANDFFIVTDKRVVYLEKIIGLYDSRQESPFSAVLSVDVQSADSLARSVGIGDVIVRTFSGPIVFTSVANPGGLAALVEEQWTRQRTRARASERDAVKSAIRREIEPLTPRPVKIGGEKPKSRGPSLTERFQNFFSFQMKYAEGDTVIYRKHMIELWRGAFAPTIGMLTVLAVFILGVAGVFPPPFTLDVVALTCLVAFTPLAGWWLYEFEDWKNDLYLVTGDQIIDLYRKPFGEETRKSAPLGNVLSLKYERPGIIGSLLNYGSVVAKVGAEELRFEGVFDPVGVQNDIYRRIEDQKARKEAADAARRRDELAYYLGIYHEVIQEEEKKRS
jgi:hypothetical protein